MTISPHILFPAVLACYFVWRVYIRIRGHIGRQPLKPRRFTVRIIIYCVIALVVGLGAMRGSLLLAGLGGGLALGALLAIVGLRLTTFETTPEGQFYIPNTVIGIGLTLLFVGRIAYRITVFYGATSRGGSPAASLGQSPLTLLILGLLLGYYTAYYAGLLLRDNRQKAVSAQSTGVVNEV